MQTIPDKYPVILAGIGLAAFLWICESAIHVVLLQESDFVRQLVSPGPHELWMRTVTFALILIFSIYIQIVINRLRRAEQKIKRAHTELNQIFQTAAGGMRVVDRNKNIRCVNKTFLDMVGISEDETLGMKCYEAFPGSLCHTDSCPLTRILGGEEHVESEAEKERSDGSRIPCVLTATLFRNPDGEVIGIVEDFKDITDLKQAEEDLKKHRDHLQDLVAERTAELTVTNEQLQQEITERNRIEQALQESERFLQGVFDGIQDGISVIDNDLNIIRVNRWMEIAYASQAPLEGRKCYALYQQRESPCPWCPSLRAIETGEVQSEIIPYPSEEKPSGWIDLTAFPLKDSTGDVTAVIEYAKDITEQKHFEDQLFQILNDQIRNPLQVIKGYVDLNKGEFSDQIDKQIEIIDNLVTQLDRGWLESEKVRSFLVRHYRHGAEILPEEW